MFCTKCGLKNDDDSLFCAGCGAPLKRPQYTQNMNYESNTGNADIVNNTDNSDNTDNVGDVDVVGNADDADNVSDENSVPNENNVSGDSIVANESNTVNNSVTGSEDAGAQQNDISSARFTQVSDDIVENKADDIIEENIKSIGEEVHQIEKEEKCVQPQAVAQQPFFVTEQPQTAVQQERAFTTEQPQTAVQQERAFTTEQPQAVVQQGQSFVSAQPQFNNAGQNFAQSSGIGNTQQYGGQQNMNGQNSNFGQQFSVFPNEMSPDANTGVQKNKFSFKRFFFSMIIILASIAACAGIALDYVGIKFKISYEDDSITEKEVGKGYDIIKEDVKDSDLYGTDAEFLGEEAAQEITDSAKLFRIMVIVFECTMIVFVIIDFILLVAVRRRGAYIFTLLFSLVKMGLGGYVIYLWCFDMLDKYQKAFEVMAELGMDIKLTAAPELGLILSAGLQILIFVCSIVLLTCKNRKKLA